MLLVACLYNLQVVYGRGLRGLPECEKWIIGYNFGMDDGAKSNFGAHKELTVLNFLKYK